jgi:hypothetical protein
LNKKFNTDFVAELGDGKYLCQIANKIKPGSIPNIMKDQSFGRIENLARFIRLCKDSWNLSLVFREVDIVKNYNPVLVVNTLHELAKQAHKFNSQLPELISFDDALPDEVLSVAVNYTKRLMINSVSPR